MFVMWPYHINARDSVVKCYLCILNIFLTHNKESKFRAVCDSMPSHFHRDNVLMSKMGVCSNIEICLCKIGRH